jgi:uncharacterized protein (DUF433 family)
LIDDDGRPARVIGTGCDVWEVIAVLEDHGSVEAVIDAMEWTEEQIAAAIWYRERHSEEIALALAANRRPAEEWAALYPFVVPGVP